MQIQLGEKEFIKLQTKLEKYNKTQLEDKAKYITKSHEFIYSQLVNLRDIEIHYEPVVRYFSTAKILLVCCAETYVNEVAAIVLKGKSLDEFDKLSLVGKWIFIQDLAKVKVKLTVDKNPLQGFIELNKERNKLVHFKGSKKELHFFQTPDFLEDLKLTPKACLQNIENVKNLIKTFSINWKGSIGPDWLNINSKSYRNPCFYLGDREISLVLYSEKHDKNRT